MNTYESITFEVEKDLTKPEKYLPMQHARNAFNDIFRRTKGTFGPKQIFKMFFASLDRKENIFFNHRCKSLIQGLILAYKNHYPITVTPDMIWLLIEQGFCRYMDKYHDSVWEKFVNFSGKKELKVKRINMTPYTAKQNDWKDIIDEFVQKIEENVGKDLIDNLGCDFSTTKQPAKIASQITIMAAMKEYFTYRLLMAGCGISSITLEGSVEDWEKIKSKIEFLKTKGLEWWTKHLFPIIDNIIITKKYYTEKKTLNEQLIDFWKRMIRVKGKGDFYFPHLINGWIVKFFPNLDGENPTVYEEMCENNIPDQIIACPMELTFVPEDGKKKIVYKCSLASGFFGMYQDKNTFNIRPIIGYAIVSEEEKEYEISEDELKMLIKEFS